MATVTHGSWVTWVMGQELNGSLGSWVTLSDPFPALVHCIGLRWPKLQLLAHFDFGGSRTDPCLPMKVKFGVQEQTQGLHLDATRHLNVFIVWISGGQKPQFWANYDFVGLLYRTPLPMRAKFCVL